MVKKDNRGRKPVAPDLKKVAVQIYIPQFEVKQLGGMKQTKNKLLNFIKTTLDAKKTL